MYFKQLQQLLRRLTLLPIFTTALILALALALFYYRELGIQAEQRFTNLTAIAAELSAPLLTDSNSNVEATLNALIQHKHVDSVRIVNAEQMIIGQLGQRFLNKTPQVDWFTQSVQRNRVANSNILRIVHPVFSKDHNQIIGWVDLGFDTTSAQFAYLDMLLGILVICLVMPAIVALILQDKISRLRPDTHAIEQGVHAISRGDYSNVIEVSEKSVFTPLAEDLNALSSSVQQAQAELKRNIEHNIDELRETMETIEIQNIELDLARKRALEASRIKSEFLANASHEFRTPLNGIIGFTQLLLKADISETQQEFLRTIETSAQGLLTIINDILDISHIEAGTVNLDYIPMRLDTVVEETLQILAPTAFQNQLELISMVEPDLPLELVSDPLRIKQILTNLINNAIKFSVENNILIQVKRDQSGVIKPTSAKSMVYRFEISGIDKEIQFDTEEAIKEFSNLESGSTRANGDNGLGLAISKGLIKALGGTLGIETQNDTQVLWFAVPLDQGQKSKPYVEKALTGLSVTLCSANPQLMQQVRQLTSNWKLSITELNDPMRVLPAIQQLTQSGKFQQLLIMDVPVIESKTTATSFLDQLTYQLNSDYHCKTLLLTTPNKQRELIEAELNRAVAFSSKPLIRDRVYKSICTHLNIYKQFYKPTKTQNKNLTTTKPKILAVDDNPANLMLVREFLVNLGAETVTAASGEDAIAECDKQSFDLIFMDIQMPGLDGIEATKEIRKRAPKGVRTPVVALTAHAVNDRKSELLLAGLDDYLSKPITEEQLAHVIQRWCNQTVMSSKEKTATEQPPNTERQSNLQRQSHSFTQESLIPSPKVDANSNPSDEIATNVLQLRSTTQAQEANNISADKISKPVDISLCLQLAGNKPDLAKDMLAMLISGLPENLETIDQCVQSKDLDKLEDIIHRIRGGAKCTGTPKLAEASSLLDKMLFNKEYENIYPALSSVIDAIEELILWDSEYDLETLFEAS